MQSLVCGKWEHTDTVAWLSLIYSVWGFIMGIIGLYELAYWGMAEDDSRIVGFETFVCACVAITTCPFSMMVSFSLSLHLLQCISL